MGLSDRIEHALLRAFVGVVSRLSARSGRALARGLGDLAFDVVRIRRSVTLGNLEAAFPERTDADRRRIARGAYRSFAQTSVDLARMNRLPREARLAMGDVAHREHLEAVASAGRGAILLTAHFGNWEWLGSLPAALGHRTKAIVGEHHNKLAGAYIDSIRARLGVGTLPAEKGLKDLILAMREGNLVVIVGDQDAGRDGVFVELMGRPASTAVGPVRLARRFGVPILQGFAVRLPDGRLRAEFLPPLLVPRGEDEGEDIRCHTEILTRNLEAFIRRYPEQWFWMHRRWKTRPRP